MKYFYGISISSPVSSRARQGCSLAPSLFYTSMDRVLVKVADQSRCRVSVGYSRINDHVFTDDAVLLGEALEILVMALEVLHEEEKPFGT